MKFEKPWTGSDISCRIRCYIADISGYWGRLAECLDRSLDTYTTPPSNPSFTGALHQDLRPGWMSIFGSGFGLRCFQPLSDGAWLPGMPYQTTGKL